MIDENELRNAKVVGGPPEPGQPQSPYREEYNNSWALVVGINQYEDLNRLSFAVNDARAVADLLKTEFGFKDEHVFLRLDREATKEEIEGLIERLIEQTQPNDRVIIYFAGHGVTRFYAGGARAEGYLAPVNAKSPNWLTFIATANLTDRINNAEAKHIFCIFNACFSGLVFTRADGPQTKYRSVLYTNPARLALTAGLYNQAVKDGGGQEGHSIFTYYLLEGLRGKARGGVDDVVTASQLMNYVKENVSSYPGSIQTPDSGGLPGHGRGDLLFVSTAARLPLEIEQDLNHRSVNVRRPAIKRLGEPLPPGTPEMLRIQRDKLAEVLKSDDLSDAREEAARSFLRLADPLSFDILVEALFAADQGMTPDVRRTIVQAVDGLRLPQAVEPLVRALREDKWPPVQEAAALALGELKNPTASATLCEVLRSDAPREVRIAAAKALNALADPETFSVLEEALKKDAEAEVRKWATRALGQMSNERAVYALSRTVLGDEDVEVRKWATRALGQLQDVRATAALMIDLEYDPDATVRSDALKNLRNLTELDTIGFITKALADKEVEIRREAVRLLGKLNHPRAIRPLRQALKDTDPSVRQAAVEALGSVEFPEAVSALVEALDDEDDNIRRYAVQGLMGVSSAEAAKPLVRLLREDKDLRVRGLAAAALGNLRDAAFADDLFAALTAADADSRLKEAAALSLGALGDKRALDYLTKAMQGNDRDARRNAVIVAGGMNAPEAAQDLRNILENDPDDSVRVAAADSLGKLTPPAAETKELLARVMGGDGAEEVRAAAAESLGALGNAAYLKPLTDLLTKQGEADTVRGGAASGLGLLGDVAALKPLADALNDPSDKVRLEAIVGLGRLDDPAVVEPLTNVLLNQAISYILRDEAAQQLLELGHPGALEAILKALEVETEPMVVQTLAAGIAQLEGARKSAGAAADDKSQQSINKLIQLLLNENADVRRAAASALGDIGDETAVVPLLAALDDQSSSVAAWAVAALGKLNARDVAGELRSVYKNKERLQAWAAWASGRLQDDDALNMYTV